jgi:hypothetical protein
MSDVVKFSREEALWKASAIYNCSKYILKEHQSQVNERRVFRMMWYMLRAITIDIV